MSSTIESKVKGARNGKHSADPNHDGPVVLPFSSAPRPKKPKEAKPAVDDSPGRSSERFNPDLQRDFLELIVKGASPQGACGKLEVSLASFWNTLQHDAQFAAELQRVWDTLSFNVVSALYRAAMEGNGSAQQFWLKHRPPPRWAIPPQDQIPADELETLTNAELLDRARAEAPDLAAEIATRIAATGSGFPPEVFPTDADRPHD